MAEQESAEVDEEPTAEAEEQPADDASAEESGMAGAVDDRAAQLTGSERRCRHRVRGRRATGGPSPTPRRISRTPIWRRTARR